MSFLSRMIGIDRARIDPELKRRADNTSLLIQQEQQQLRQNVQKVESASRLLGQWDGAMKMMRDK